MSLHPWKLEVVWLRHKNVNNNRFVCSLLRISFKKSKFFIKFIYFFKHFWFYLNKSFFLWFCSFFFIKKNLKSFSVLYQQLDMFFANKHKKRFRFFFLRRFKLFLKFLKRFKFRKRNLKRFKKFFSFFLLQKKKFNFSKIKKKKVFKKISHFKRKIFLKKLITNSFFLTKILYIYKLFFISNFFFKIDSIFFSFFFNKFVSKFMLNGKKNFVYFLFFSFFFFLKVVTAIKPFFLFFSAIESSRFSIGHLPKNISGKIHIVPTFLYFDKQLKVSIKIFVSLLKKKQEYISSASAQTTSLKLKKFLKISSLFLKTHKIYFSKFTKFTQRKNVFFDLMRKNYYIYLANRSNLQYRWR